MSLRELDDPKFPGITYCRGESCQPTPVLRGTGLRVQTIAIAANKWGMSIAEIANEYAIPESKVKETQAFYDAHRTEIDAAIEAELMLERSSQDFTSAGGTPLSQSQ